MRRARWASPYDPRCGRIKASIPRWRSACRRRTSLCREPTASGVRCKIYRSNILAIVFISNHCPASQLYEGRIKAIAKDYAAKGIQLIAIAPNGPQATSPGSLNFTDVDDSFESMKIHAEYRQFNFPHLYDGETQSVAHQYGPKVTPHIFIFDQNRQLRYEGRIDDHLQEAKATTHDARDALDAMLAGRAVAVSHTPVFGCSTKWHSHSESAKRIEGMDGRAGKIEIGFGR